MFSNYIYLYEQNKLIEITQKSGSYIKLYAN